jgi:shikimate dehydrogenase
MKKLGLIGYPLSHSFSKRYFQEKFLKEGIQDYQYDLYPFENINLFPELLKRESQLVGLNVTIPYKQSIIPYLNELDETSQKIGAVNTILIKNGKTTGYNTDYIGFKQSLTHFTGNEQSKLQALVLGTGGASKAVQEALKSLQIPFRLVSRQATEIAISYQNLSAQDFQTYRLIINTTPLGMYPDTDKFPEIPYHFLDQQHFVYDLIYNPEETLFLQKAKMQGAKTKNGLEMLYLQAEAAWKIWQEN